MKNVANRARLAKEVGRESGASRAGSMPTGKRLIYVKPDCPTQYVYIAYRCEHVKITFSV
jgi:hypothetical protein